MNGKKGRRFASIKPGIWETRKFRSATSSGKLLAIYLMTNSYFSMVGIYRLPRYFMETDTGQDSNSVGKALNELIELEYCLYDDETEVIWVIDMALSQVAERPNPKQEVGVINELSRIHIDHEYPFVQEFLDMYQPSYTFLPRSADELHWDNKTFDKPS